MNIPNKPQVVTAFENLDDSIQHQTKLEYPEGFSQHLISLVNKEGVKVSALRYEAEEKIYLIKISIIMAEQLIEDDDEYYDDGNLTDDAREEYENEELED